MKDINNNLLRLVRISRNVSVKELAKELSLKTECTYYKKENGSLRFSLLEAKKLADFYQMTIEELFFNDYFLMR